MIDIVARFEDCTLPPESFHHEHHVYVVWCYLREMPLALAAQRFIMHLRLYAASIGKPDLYHETITWAYVLLTNERMARTSMNEWDAFRRENADLLTWTPSILDRYYRPGTLATERARETFLMPDAMYEELR